MNLLPWLLDWPPRPAAVVVFFLLTAFSLGTLVLLGGPLDQIETENATVDASDVSIRLNDDIEFPDTGDGVQTCLASGTPGDSIGVLGSVTVDIPSDRGRGPFAVDVSLAHLEASRTYSVEGTGHETVDLFWIVDDEEVLSVGESARLQIRVRSGEETLADTTRQVTVENGSRSYDCDESLATGLSESPGASGL